MILVTGTKRSGTSMWMQILKAAGLPIIGEAFSSVWGDSIRDANPEGFYESVFRQGIFFATNPDPRTGRFLHPTQAKAMVCKVFIPGLVRTDYAYIGRVVATMRHHKDYHHSLQRLYAMEDTWLGSQENGEARLARARDLRSKLPPEVEWWFENYDLIRDVAVRRYPINLCTYDRLLTDPQAMITKVLGWIGAGDVNAACEAVKPSLKHHTRPPIDDCALTPAQEQVCEDLFAAIHETSTLTNSLLARLNEMQDEMVGIWGKPSRDRMREDVEEASTPRAVPEKTAVPV